MDTAPAKQTNTKDFQPSKRIKNLNMGAPSGNCECPFKFEAIVSNTGKLWGYEALFNHPLIPNSKLFAVPNPELDLYLLQLFSSHAAELCGKNGNQAKRINCTFNISFATLLYFHKELSEYLAAYPGLHLEITETQASRQKRDLQPVARFLASWPGRIFIDDFLKGGHGLDFFNAVRPYLAGIKVELKDLDQITLTPSLKNGLMVVIERIETPKDYREARLKGATHFQGWLFKRYNTSNLDLLQKTFSGYPPFRFQTDPSVYPEVMIDVSPDTREEGSGAFVRRTA